MPRVQFNAKPYGKPGETECHYGHTCIVGEDHLLYADITAELAEVEVAAHRAKQVEPIPVPEVVPEPEPVPATDPFDGKSKADLQALCDAAGIKYTANQNKGELVALLQNRGV